MLACVGTNIVVLIRSGGQRQRIAVMRRGELSELAPAEELFEQRRHAYTRELPRLRAGWGERRRRGLEKVASCFGQTLFRLGVDEREAWPLWARRRRSGQTEDKGLDFIPRQI